MIEKIITSKTRVKLLKLFLTHIDDRYYLRELERKLDESLSPLRRQLIKLEKMGILKTEYEANLKYYRLDKKFAGMEELRSLVLGTSQNIETGRQLHRLPELGTYEVAQTQPIAKRTRFDIILLSVVAFLIVAAAGLMIYTNVRSVNQVADLVSGERVLARSFAARSGNIKAEATRPDQMVSHRWKVIPGNVPVLSSGETGQKRSEEL